MGMRLSWGCDCAEDRTEMKSAADNDSRVLIKWAR
jgi:hypothetical protein